MTREVHRTSFRRFICPAQAGPHHRYHTADYDVCPLPEPEGFRSVLVCHVEHSYLILVSAAACVLCACLVSVQVSTLYIIASSTL